MRLKGVDCPELRGPARERGLAAKEFVRAWIEAATGEWPLSVETFKGETFGRYVASVTRRSDGSDLAAALVAAGHAVPSDRK